MDCLFCKIIKRKASARIVYEDEHLLAFEDINPQAPVHILIIPKKHIATALDIEVADHALVGQMFQTANRIAGKEGFAEDGFRLVMNCNSQAGQSVFHIPLHLLAGRSLRWPPG